MKEVKYTCSGQRQSRNPQADIAKERLAKAVINVAANILHPIEKGAVNLVEGHHPTHRPAACLTYRWQDQSVTVSRCDERKERRRQGSRRRPRSATENIDAQGS
ncbi:hypothetical protein LJR231_005523 [Phyllobacterium sp. LjRoot231]|uniref:hypothetical protein n=1 Tax=Phyllobacterium sp. LjRoot231 TaxID=3342289 RepID=UPI003ED00EDD